MEIASIKGLDSLIDARLISESNKTKSFWTAGLTVRDQFHILNFAKIGKEIINIGFGGGVGQIAYVNIHFFFFLITQFHQLGGNFASQNRSSATGVFSFDQVAYNPIENKSQEFVFTSFSSIPRAYSGMENMKPGTAFRGFVVILRSIRGPGVIPRFDLTPLHRLPSGPPRQDCHRPPPTRHS